VRLGDEASTLRSGLATSLGAEAGLYVPLVYQGRVLGVLNAFDRVEEGPAFSNDDERLMQSFAASAAVAIASAQNAAALGLRRSLEATERERGRWARELHDETLQDLAALAIRLSAVRERATVEEMRREIDQAVAQAGAAAQTLRGLITDLRPAALDQLGLEPAVEALVERVGASTGLSVELDSDLTANGRVSHRLDAETESAAYRLVQEALTNVMKHAAAEHAAVTLTDTGETVVVTVQDDGRGFAPDDASQGFGLIGMRERVSLLGGTVEVRSELGTGTTVEATLPAARGSAALADERVAAERRP
jgi:signal transduction histidine kinase